MVGAHHNRRSPRCLEDSPIAQGIALRTGTEDHHTIAVARLRRRRTVGIFRRVAIALDGHVRVVRCGAQKSPLGRLGSVGDADDTVVSL